MSDNKIKTPIHCPAVATIQLADSFSKAAKVKDIRLLNRFSKTASYGEQQLNATAALGTAQKITGVFKFKMDDIIKYHENGEIVVHGTFDVDLDLIKAEIDKSTEGKAEIIAALKASKIDLDAPTPE